MHTSSCGILNALLSKHTFFPYNCENTDDANDADGGRRVDGAGGGLVVEADVAAGDGDVEGAAALGEAVDGLLELIKILGVVGIAEVEVVGDGDGIGADGDEVGSRAEARRAADEHVAAGDVEAA